MKGTMTRREWLARSGLLLGGGLAGWYAGWPRVLPAEERIPDAPIRMMFNENPYGPSESAKRAMVAAFPEGSLYSRDAHNTLRQMIAEREGLTPDHIVLGSGSREILQVAALACGLENGALLMPHPTFEAMGRYAETIGTRVIRVPVNDAMHIDLQAMQQAWEPGVRLVYVCNPNNPTGLVLEGEPLRQFCLAMSDKALVFVDEAYHDYVEHPGYRSMVELIREGHRQIVVSRTFSKIHGLAGLRVGYGLAHPDVVRHLASRMTGTVNIIGVRAAIASYRDTQYAAFCKQKNRQARDVVYALCKKLQRRVLDSQTNFVFMHVGMPVERFQEKMAEQGILVGRPFPPFLDWCRVSLARPEEMQLFARACERIWS